MRPRAREPQHGGGFDAGIPEELSSPLPRSQELDMVSVLFVATRPTGWSSTAWSPPGMRC